MGRFWRFAGFMVRWLPWVATGTAAAYRNLPDKSQNEIKEVAKEPGRLVLEFVSKIPRLFKKTSGVGLVHKMESSLVIEKHRNA